MSEILNTIVGALLELLSEAIAAVPSLLSALIKQTTRSRNRCGKFRR